METKHVAVKNLKVGDMVMGTDEKPHRITGLTPWAHSHIFVAIDGTADGYYRETDEVAVVVPETGPVSV